MQRWRNCVRARAEPRPFSTTRIAALTEELDDGARQLELDVYYDPQGGRFADPLGPRTLGQRLDAAVAAEFAKPGFKVMHIPDFDFRSTCIRFVACLQTVKAWSDAHPEHIPIVILINAKDDSPLGTGGAAIAKFDTAAFDALDAEVASVFSDEAPHHARPGTRQARDAARRPCSPAAGRSCATRAVASSSRSTRRRRKWRSIAASGARSKAAACS